MSPMGVVEAENDLIDCRDCGSTFDLSKQSYHDSLCPECVDDERTHPPCARCGEPVPPGERETEMMGGGFGVKRERVPVHGGCKGGDSRP